MKSLAVLTVAAIAATGAYAQEQGRVLSSTPITQQVAVPQQVCSDQPVAVAPRPSGAGAVVGAIAGGLLGNVVGGGSGRAGAEKEKEVIVSALPAAIVAGRFL